MRRAILAVIVVGGILLVPFLVGGLHRAVADAAGLSGDISEAAAGNAEDPEQGEPAFAVAGENREDAWDGDRGERRRSGHPHRSHDGRHRHGPPSHDMHGRRGPPGPPPGIHQAMRRFDEIIERLAKIESKLGIDDPVHTRRERRPRPDDRDADRGGPGPYRAGGPRTVEEMGRPREERFAEMRQRVEDARRRFREMEERVGRLEAELERMQDEKRGP